MIQRSRSFLLIDVVLLRVDEFLQWNPDDFNGIRRLNLPSKLIWLPDIVLYNASAALRRRAARRRASF